MALPKLTVISDNVKTRPLHCSSRPDRCDNCPAHKNNGGLCRGCTPLKLSKCEMSSCWQECNTCTGYKVEVPAICVKAPLRNVYMSAVTGGAPSWAKAEYKFHSQKRIDLKCKTVVVARGGGVKLTKDSPYVPELEMIGVTLSDVWSKGGGWFSHDLKDYLRLRRHQKLMLVTSVRDDILEDGWDAECFGGESHSRVGFDYWMPLSFSTYKKDSYMQQYFSVLRTMYAIMRGRAHFCTLTAYEGLDLDHYYKEAIGVLKQMLVTSQFLVNDQALLAKIAWIKKWNDLTPATVPLWSVGMATPRYIHNVRKYAPERDLYFVSANPFRLAGHGKRLFDTGLAKKDPSLSKDELMYENQRALIRTVERYSKKEG